MNNIETENLISKQK